MSNQVPSDLKAWRKSFSHLCAQKLSRWPKHSSGKVLKDMSSPKKVFYTSRVIHSCLYAPRPLRPHTHLALQWRGRRRLRHWDPGVRAVGHWPNPCFFTLVNPRPCTRQVLVSCLLRERINLGAHPPGARRPSARHCPLRAPQVTLSDSCVAAEPEPRPRCALRPGPAPHSPLA
jgi:hypothetical protein